MVTTNLFVARAEVVTYWEGPLPWSVVQAERDEGYVKGTDTRTEHGGYLCLCRFELRIHSHELRVVHVVAHFLGVSFFCRFLGAVRLGVVFLIALDAREDLHQRQVRE